MKTLFHIVGLIVVCALGYWLFRHHHPYWLMSEMASYFMGYAAYFGGGEAAGDVGDFFCDIASNISDCGDWGGDCESD